MQINYTAQDILQILKNFFSPPEWALLPELRLGTGYGGKNNKWERRIDAWAINCYPSKGLIRIAFEIKVSRSDFLAELKQPEKREPAMEVSNNFYFVAPKGMIRPEEVPEYCGLLEVSDGAFERSVQAVYRDCPPPPWRFVASLARQYSGKIT